jgi:hypothetical protein
MTTLSPQATFFIMAVPAATPVTMNGSEPVTVATAVFELVHVPIPPQARAVSEITEPTHTLVGPVICAFDLIANPNTKNAKNKRYRFLFIK